MSGVDSQSPNRPEDTMALVNGMATLHAPAATAIAMDHLVRQRIAGKLRERADWFRHEYLHGGDFEHLSARERECRHLATQIEESRL